MPETPRSLLGAVRVFHCEQAIVVAAVGHLCVVIWRGAVTKYPFDKQRSGLAQIVAQYPNDAGFLCVVESSTKPPDDELRRESTRMLESHGERLKYVACVIEGEGFRTAINRGALAGMILLRRNRTLPISVFSNVRSAVQWMGQFAEIPSVDALTSSIEHIRSRFPAPLLRTP
jgi:hypothetical protein